MDTFDWGELEALLAEHDTKQAQLFQLNLITENLPVGKVNRQAVELMLEAVPDLFNTDRYPVASFSMEDSEVNADVVYMSWGKVVSKLATELSQLSLRSAVLLTAAILWLLGRLKKRLFGGGADLSKSSGGAVGPAYVAPQPAVAKTLTQAQIDELSKDDNFIRVLYTSTMKVDWEKVKPELDFLLADVSQLLSVMENTPKMVEALYEKYKDTTEAGTMRKNKFGKLEFVPKYRTNHELRYALNNCMAEYDRTENNDRLPLIIQRNLELWRTEGYQMNKFYTGLKWAAYMEYMDTMPEMRKGEPNLPKLEVNQVQGYAVLIGRYRRKNRGNLPIIGSAGRKVVGPNTIRLRKPMRELLASTWAQGKPLGESFLGSLKVWDKNTLEKMEQRVEEVNKRLKNLLESDEFTSMVRRHRFDENPPMFAEETCAMRPMFPVFEEKVRNAHLDGKTVQEWPANVEYAATTKYLMFTHKHIGAFIGAQYVAPMRVVMESISKELEMDEKLRKLFTEWNVSPL